MRRHPAATALQAAAEAVAAGAGMLAAAAPEAAVSRLISEAATTASAAAAAEGALRTSLPASEPPPAATAAPAPAGAPQAPPPAGAASADAPAGADDIATAAMGSLGRADMELLALAVASEADSAREQAGGRREAVAGRLVREVAAYEAAVSRVAGLADVCRFFLHGRVCARKARSICP
jgi:hypothetical protein